MADKTATHLPELITSDNTSNFVLTIDNPVAAAGAAYKTFSIVVVSGIWHFNNNGEANASESSATWTTSDDPLSITIHGNKLQCRSATGGDTFKISM